MQPAGHETLVGSLFERAHAAASAIKPTPTHARAFTLILFDVGLVMGAAQNGNWVMLAICACAMGLQPPHRAPANAANAISTSRIARCVLFNRSLFA
jgi:hypothetical protein